MGLSSSTLPTIAGYLALLVLGAWTGSRRFVRSRSLEWLGAVQTVILLAIILALGVQLGANEEVTASLAAIGVSALLIALLAMTGSVLCLLLLRRFVLRLDRYAAAPGAENDAAAAEEDRADDRLTWYISAAVILGYGLGRWLLPGAAAAGCGRVVTLGLDLMLFLIGLDLGRHGEALSSLKTVGLKPLLVPTAVVVGSLTFGALAGLVLPFTSRDTAAVAAGMGWYSLAPTILARHSLKLSAMAFFANVLREILSILFIPSIARRLGFLECVAVAGATAMDTVMPVILSSTSRRITVYTFVSGLVCSLLVPVLIPLVAGI